LRLEVYDLYGESDPCKIISVGANLGLSSHLSTIRAYDVSDTGDYAATLYFTDGIAHLDVWDLRKQGTQCSTDGHQIYNKLFAQTTFEVARSLSSVKYDEKLPITINISRSGLHVAVGTVRITAEDNINDGDDGEDRHLPFRMFSCPPVAPVDKDPHEPWELKLLTTPYDGKTFTAFAFHTTLSLNESEECEWFWTQDDNCFAIYSIQKKWRQIHTIDLQNKFNTDIFSKVNVQGNYMAWTSSIGVIVVKKFDTGKAVSRIYTEDERGETDVVLSRDGSMVAVRVNSAIHILDTTTGIKRGVRQDTIGGTEASQFLFGLDRFMVAPKTDDVSKWEAIDIQRMSLEREIMIESRYDVRYPQTGPEPVFSFKHVCRFASLGLFRLHLAIGVCSTLV
jgi:hypothetical protein